MISEQHVIEKMRQTMVKIEQTSGTAQVEQLATMKAYCELLLEQPGTPAADVVRSQTAPAAKPDVDPMLARFMGVAQEDEQKGPSLLDF